MIRKYTFLLLLAFLFLPFEIAAQQRRFSGGVSAGFTRADISGMNGGSIFNIKNMQKTGLSTGLLVAYSLDENNFLQMEINYTQKGCKSFLYGYTSSYDYYMVSLNYFDVPLLYRFAGEMSNYNLLAVFEGGISIGELYESHVYESIYGQGIYPLQNNVLQFRQTDVGMIAGFGFCFPSGIYMGQRFCYSAYPVVKRDPLPAGMRIYGLGRGHNVDTQIYLQYCFGKAKMRVPGW
jgi:hypothetical protein